MFSIPIPPDPYPNPEHLHVDLVFEQLEHLLASQGFTVKQRETCMFGLSRAVLWLTAAAHAPLPLVPLCRLEQATSRWIKWSRPYDFLCLAVKS